MFARLQNLPAPDAVAPLPKRLRPTSPSGARGVVLQDHVERDLVSRMAALEDFQRSDHSHRMRDTRDLVGKTDRIREDVGYLRINLNEIKRMKDDLRVVKEEVHKRVPTTIEGKVAFRVCPGKSDHEYSPKEVRTIDFTGH